jgi:photosystem II stability/assembly factor-like uncharacterized protein
MWRRFFLAGLLCSVAQAQVGVTNVTPKWVQQESGTTATLRGISAVSSKIAWASGTQATILRTTDGGKTWVSVGPPGVSDVDFRDIEAFDESTAVVMSSGAGRLSRIYRTTDGGKNWASIKINLDPEGFWDAMAFWDPEHGILMGDPVRDRFTVLITSDGGFTWSAREGPKAQPGVKGVVGEAAFAASGTALAVRGGHEAWFVTGGPSGGRVLHTEDGGDSWTAVHTPVHPTLASSGLNSIAFAEDGKHGIAVGGDYTKPNDATKNIATTTDGGKTWIVPVGSAATATSVGSIPGGYRSAAAYVAAQKMWILTGTSGSEFSTDPLSSTTKWKPFDQAAYNAISFTATGAGWAVGPQGAIATFVSETR